MRLPPWTVFYDPFSNAAVRTGSHIIKIGFFPLVEQTQAKNKLNGNLVVQTFQKQSLSIPKTNTAFLLETSVWHSEAIQFWSDSRAALSPSRDKWTLYRQQGAAILTPLLAIKSGLLLSSFHQKRLACPAALLQQDGQKLDVQNGVFFWGPTTSKSLQ